MQWLNNINKCDIVLYAQDQNSQWYVDSGCSRHMTGDISKCVTLDEKKTGNVTFGNDKVGRIKGKWTVILNNGRGKAQDVLFTDGLKHNLLSVSQICDKGCEVLFRDQYCELRSITTGKNLVKGFQIKINVYIMKDESEGRYIRKIDESWLWHRRLGHLNFDHIIKLSKKKAVRDFNATKKPKNTICKSCQMGQKTCTSFKAKDQLSTNKPLLLVHMGLCRPSRTNTLGGESYFMLIIDDFSRLTWVEFLRYKSEAFEKFKIFKTLVEIKLDVN